MPALPPGPRLPALVQAVQFGRDPIGFLERCAARYGDAFTLRLPNDPPRVVFSDPASIKQIFAMRPDAYRSDNQSIHLNLGEHSVLFQDGERHRRQRKLMTPVLGGARLRAYAETMAAATREELDTWPVNRDFAVSPRMQQVTLDVFLRCVFGLEGEEAVRQRRRAMAWLEGVISPQLFATGMVVNANRLRRMLDRAVEHMRAPGPRPLLFRKVAKAKVELLDMLQAQIRQRRSEGTEGRDDVLSMLVDARYEDGAPMEDEDILSQLITLLVGGHDTTANSLAWALSLLARHPEVTARVHEELEEVFGDGPVDPARAKELSYLDMVIKESMRLVPIAPAVSRTLTRDRELGGLHLPAGTIVWASVYLTQRRPELWDDPAAFRPERFTDRKAGSNELFPFGGGARRCLGALFATFEMRIVLAELLHRFDLHAAGPAPSVMFSGIVMSPTGGAQLRVTPRR
ncbi:MAG: cytochrome P450 [Myxococcota bacterium]